MVTLKTIIKNDPDLLTLKNNVGKCPLDYIKERNEKEHSELLLFMGKYKKHVESVNFYQSYAIVSNESKNIGAETVAKCISKFISKNEMPKSFYTEFLNQSARKKYKNM